MTVESDTHANPIGAPSGAKRSLFYILFTLSVLIGLIPILRYAGLIDTYAVNVPTWDDFDAVLEFLLRYLESETLAEKLYLVFKQHNEHRILIHRLLVLIEWFVFGAVNFRHQAMFANIAFLLFAGNFAVLFKRMIPQKGKTLWQSCWIVFVLPVLFLQLHPQYEETVVWSGSNVAVFWTTALTLSMLLLLEMKKTVPLVSAFLLLPVCVFSMGNGVLSPIAGGFLLGFQKRYRLLLGWILWSLVIWFLFFTDYHPSHGNPSPIEGLQNFSRSFNYGLALIGAGFSFSSFSIGWYGGVVFLLWFSYLALSKRFLEAPVLCSFLLFLLGTMAITSLSRAAFGVELAVSTARYKFIACLLLCCWYATLILVVQGTKGRIMALLPLSMLSVFIWQKSFEQYTWRLRHYRDDIITTDLVHWCLGGEGLSYPWRDRSDRIIQETIDRRVYDLPESALRPTPVSSLPSLHSDKRRVKRSIDQLIRVGDDIFIRGWAKLKHPRPDLDTYTLLIVPKESAKKFHSDLKAARKDVSAGNAVALDDLISDSGIQVIRPKREMRKDVQQHLGGEFDDKTGFAVLLPQTSLPSEFLLYISIDGNAAGVVVPLVKEAGKSFFEKEGIVTSKRFRCFED